MGSRTSTVTVGLTPTSGGSMHRQRTMAIAALSTLGVLLAGCSDATDRASDDASSSGTPTSSPSASDSGSDSGSPSASGSPSDAASTDPDAQGPGLPTSRLAAASYHKAVLGQNAARDADEQAVVAAWMRFWQGAADTYFNQEVPASFDAVATGDARTSIVSYMRRTKAQQQRVVGWAQDNVTSVRITGDRATVRDCTKNFTFRIDEEGEPLTRPDPWYDVIGQLRQTDGQWRVVSQTSKSRTTTCLR